MKSIVTITALLGLFAAGAPAGAAGNIYLVTVPINASGLKAGTAIDVSCAGGTDVAKGDVGDPNAMAATMDANPPKNTVKVTVVVGQGPADAIVPLVIVPSQNRSGEMGLTKSYQCWSNYGGYVTGSLAGAAGSKAPANDVWNLVNGRS